MGQAAREEECRGPGVWEAGAEARGGVSVLSLEVLSPGK